MSARHPALARAEAFAASYGLRRPLLLAPMAGACPPALSVAVMREGGLGACGALLMQPAAILAWADAVREAGPFQINLWIPDPAPARDPAREAGLRAFLGRFGPAMPPDAGDGAPPDFAAQCEALIEARPRIVSSIMGLYPPAFVARLKERGIAWWATVTTVAEALAAQEAGADAVVAQGAEAGGHRGAFEAAKAETGAVGLMALLPAVVDAVKVPVVAAGGIADARGAAAALLLGASAVQIGTGFLRCPEAGIPPAWADGLGRARPEDTRLTRAFSGRTGRSLATAYVAAAAGPDAPAPAPYPIQRGLTQAMREAAVKEGDLARMQAWAGQAAGLAQAVPAGEVVGGIWEGIGALLR
ncbi:nitronate monooxygenase [Methylobacterium currus]|uniref:Propionate 3-nitronate monooxygenase n=1 Tax=Methylobacterium currus TaxID=2051553 RepID=A0A2R4WN90_9HYPH|nr:nitronate monooxygenase [Methylobacterium currus]AWB23004.1 nitronate monooxygenase [Methylobacterium currus]